MTDKTREELIEEIKLLQKRIAEQQQQQQQQKMMGRLATVVRDSNDAITIQDFEGKITAWNHGAELMYGYSEKEALQKSIDLLTHPDKVAEQKEFTRRLQAGEAITSFETQRVTKDGRILDVWLTVTKVVDDDGETSGIASTERDITERKQQQQQQQEVIKKLNKELEDRVRQRTADLATTNDNLVRSNKELEQFAYVAAHDLQEPLRMISSYTQLLAKRYEGQLDDKAKKYIEYAVDGAIRMHSLINDLLSYSRVGRRDNPLELADSHSILGSALRNLAAVIEENRAIITNDELPTVRTDPSQLALVFQNLLSNAIKFRVEDRPRVHVSAQDKGPEWVFSIRDNGIGIAPQYQDRLFVIFRRLHTKQEYPGTGIGLAICRKILEQHGGRIWFESEPGKGSTFFFTIPK